MKSFIKTLGIIVLAAVMVFAMAGCSNGGGSDDPNDPNNPNSPNNPNNKGPTGDPNGTDEPEIPRDVNAQVPTITVQPVEAFYDTIDARANPLTVTASVTDGGTLTYKWYTKLDENTEIDGTPVSGAADDGPSYTPSTAVKSGMYYYVKVTNTIPDDGTPGTKTASIKSKAVFFGVQIVKVNLVINGNPIRAKDKVYDGTDTVSFESTAGIAGTPGLPASVPSSRATLHTGGVKFEQSDVGTGINVIFDNQWYLEGEYKGDYFFRTPTDLKANITKAPGGTISTITTGTILGDRITVASVTLAGADTGQTYEYSIDTANNKTAATLTRPFQDSSTIKELTAKTTYYIYVRTKESGNYNAGAIKISAAVSTDDPTVYLNPNGGTGSAAYVTITKGNVMTPANVGSPTKAGYRFDNWYTDEAMKTPHDFSTAINDNMNLYARWVSEEKITARDSNSGRNMKWIQGGYFQMGTNGAPPTSSSVTYANGWSSAVRAWLGYSYGGQYVGYNFPNNTEKYHRVTLSGFWMSKYEVTQELWMSVMSQIPGYVKPGFNSGIETETPARLPINGISFYDAIVFCNRLSLNDDLTPVYTINNSRNPDDWGAIPTASTNNWNNVTMDLNANGYRLPTEAEWEYAARTVKDATTSYYWGGVGSANSWSNDWGWVAHNSRVLNGELVPAPLPSEPAPTTGSAQTHKVGLKPAGNTGNFDSSGYGNRWGLCDMLGNVSEWCWDGYKIDLGTDAVVNPITPFPGPDIDGKRIIRGGNYNSAMENRYYLSSSGTRTDMYGPTATRVAFRCETFYSPGVGYIYGAYNVYSRYTYCGMRLVRSWTPADSE